MKRITLFLLTFFSAAVLNSQAFFKSLEPGNNQMAVYVGSYDWGPCINKIVINTGNKHNPEDIKLSDFEVEKILYQKVTGIAMSKGELTLTDAFCSDSKGNRISHESNYITILTDVYPTAENSSPFPNYLSSGVFDNFFNYRVTNDDLDLKITKLQGFVNEEVSKFSSDSFSFTMKNESSKQTITMPYVYYFPENESNKKVPLILWLHGLGESGFNPYLVIMGTKATALAGEKIQGYFEDGAAILAPQCPTGWLETTEQSAFGLRYWAPIDIDTPVNTIANPIRNFLKNFMYVEEEEEEAFAAVSFYTEPLVNLLYTFLEQHPEIDRNRIYIGGCSAGGYMTVNMMIQHPELFAAAFPICEYYLNSKISKKQIKALAEKPFWFTYALNDDAVNPKKNSIPTIKRLKEAGAKNIKYSEFPNVIDMTGTILKDRDADEDDDDYGLPYEYEGHHSWIYVLNDQCRDEDELSLFEWLSRQ